MRICGTCNKNPVRAEKQSRCAVCHNEYQKAYYKKNPRSISDSVKRRRLKIRNLLIEAKNKPCMDCGNSYSYFVMDFDHVRGKKNFGLAEASNKLRSLSVVKEEISKCDVVCANCHRQRTFSRM